MTYTGESSVSSKPIMSSPLVFAVLCGGRAGHARSSRATSSGLGLAQQVGPRVLAPGELAERLERLACLRVEALGHLHVHGDQEVAHRGVGTPDALARDPERAAVRRA